MEFREFQKTKRIAWVDNCKAFAISLVALGHMQSIYVVNEIIFSFAMPVFFFLSGYTFERSANAPFVELLRKKFKSLIIPYVGFSAVLFVFWFFVRRNFGMSYQTDATVTDVLSQILCGVNSDFFVTPLWFLTCLFVTEIFFWSLLRLRKQWVALSIILLLFVFGIYYWVYMDSRHFPHLFWNVDQTCFYLYFLAVGFMVSKRGIVEKLFCSLKLNIAVILGLSVVFALSFVARENTLIVWQILLLQALMCNASLFVFVVICKMIPENKVLNFVGQNTLVILALHMMVQSVLRGILFKFFHMAPDGIESSLGLSGLLTLMTLAILVPVILLINRFVPWLAGKKVKSS